MRIRSLAVVAAAGVFALAAGVQAQSVPAAERFGAGLGVGSNGVTVEGTYEVDPHLVLRGQGAFLDFNEGFHSSDLHYEGRVRFNTGGAFADLHPWANPFFVSGGAVVGSHRVDVSAFPTVSGQITIGGHVYNTSQVTSVHGNIDYGGALPFAGLGWDSTYFSKRRIGFRVLAGALVGHSSHVNLQAVGPYATDPGVISYLQTEDSTLGHDADRFRIYPIVQVGLTYRF